MYYAKGGDGLNICLLKRHGGSRKESTTSQKRERERESIKPYSPRNDILHNGKYFPLCENFNDPAMSLLYKDGCGVMGGGVRQKIET